MPSRTKVKIRIVCLSDTHNATPGSGFVLPKGDILIHAGDLTNQGSLPEIQTAIAWIQQADFVAKIIVAGNHDLSLDADYALKHQRGWSVIAEDVEKCRVAVKQAEGVIYLEHESATVAVNGVKLKFFGSPYSPDRGKQNWAFQYLDDKAASLWSSVPADTDILITHTPSSLGLDTSAHWTEGGCGALAKRLQEVRPVLHVCGHCHEGRGAEVVHWSDSMEVALERTEWIDPGAGNKKQSLLDLTSGRDGLVLTAQADTAIVNASIMAKSWGRGFKVFNKPVVVDLEVPNRQR